MGVVGMGCGGGLGGGVCCLLEVPQGTVNLMRGYSLADEHLSVILHRLPVRGPLFCVCALERLLINVCNWAT